MHGIVILAIALGALVFSAACGSSANNAGSSNSATSTPSTNTSPPTRPAGMSPTETLKAYFDVAKRKDIEALKKFLSRGTMQVMEEIAKGQGKTLDQMFKEGAERDAQMPMPEFTNEKIDGDTATVDIKAPGKPIVSMQMVKEDGEWKLAVDKMLQGRARLGGEEHRDHNEN